MDIEKTLRVLEAYRDALKPTTSSGNGGGYSRRYYQAEGVDMAIKHLRSILRDMNRNRDKEEQ